MPALPVKQEGRFGALFCLLFVLAFSAHAQQRVVAVLLATRAPIEYREFPQQLAKLGWQDGQNLRLILRNADGNFNRLPGLAAELVSAKPDVLVSIFTPPTKAAIQATSTIPIVGFFGEPVALGFVGSVARPGGNVTGVTNLCGETAGKRLTLLRDAIPNARRIAAILNANDPVTGPQIEELKRLAPKLGIEMRYYGLKTADDLTAAFDDAVKWPADAGLWICGQSEPYRRRAIELSLKHRLPTMVLRRQDAEEGGLLSYFADHNERFRMVAAYVDRILKGAKPADMPIDQPLQLQLVVNLKTARSLGVRIPQSLLARADVIIE